MDNGLTIGFFEGFSWAVPRAFCSTLSTCRFEQGDTFYDNRNAYRGIWGNTVGETTSYCLQVQSPSKSSVARLAMGAETDPEAEGKQGSEQDLEHLFRNNWGQKVVFNLIDYRTKKEFHGKEVSSTQGRLYTFLWSGDFTVLDESTSSPEMPTLVSAVIPNLRQAVVYFQQDIPRGLNAPLLFIMAYDETHDLLRIKFEKTRDALKKAFAAKVVVARPEEVGLLPTKGRRFAPTVRVSCLYVEAPSPEAIDASLKRVLYTPAKDKKTVRENWRLASHGYLHAQREAAPAEQTELL